eukprot:2627775-Pyramimonas_sp.AAC.1
MFYLCLAGSGGEDDDFVRGVSRDLLREEAEGGRHLVAHLRERNLPERMSHTRVTIASHVYVTIAPHVCVPIVGSWTQGEKRDRVSGVFSAPLRLLT